MTLNSIGTMPTQPFGPDQIAVSRIALGCMGLAGTWNPSDVGPEHIRRAITAFEAALEAGVTFFDHADIYGRGACETVFKECLAAVQGSRDRIFIATKGGIRFDPFGHYDHSAQHLTAALHGSLERMGIDHVDLYQLHRPDPLSHPAETAATLDGFVAQGLVRTIGVSNYYPHQTAALRRYLKAPIVSNQVSISLLRLDPIYEGAAGGPGSVDTAGDGVLDDCLEKGMTPLAYSPVGGGWLSGRREIPPDESRKARIERIRTVMQDLSPVYGDVTPTQLVIAWLLRHPARIIPLVGSNDPEHIREAAAAARIQLSHIDWYRLWVAARGEPVP
jgi:predicted oxidoreductase